MRRAFCRCFFPSSAESFFGKRDAAVRPSMPEEEKKMQAVQWPRRLLRQFGVELPIIGAPMAFCGGPALCLAVSAAGGLGSLPFAGLSMEQCREELELVRRDLKKGERVNVNYFCHVMPDLEAYLASESWVRYERSLEEFFGLKSSRAQSVDRRPFDEASCELVEAFGKDLVVSFHFGLPRPDLLKRVKASGAIVGSSATTVEEAVYLEDRGCDFVIAQGAEAGGHQATFLTNPLTSSLRAIGTMALVPQVVDAVKIPVVAAGGVSDGRGVAAAFALGADAVQMGSAFLRTRESLATDFHKLKLDRAAASDSLFTNIFSGRPARSLTTDLIEHIGPLNPHAPPFPTAAAFLTFGKKNKQETTSSMSLWAGQGLRLAPTSKDNLSATELTLAIAQDAKRRLGLLPSVNNN